MTGTRSKLDEIVASFATLEDPRSEINRRHPLPSVLVIAVLAVLAGAAGPTAIARWAKYKEDLLVGILDHVHISMSRGDDTGPRVEFEPKWVPSGASLWTRCRGDTPRRPSSRTVGWERSTERSTPFSSGP